MKDRKTVHEMAKLAGISVRTLHYYDELGLLCPAEVTEAGYRLYGAAELRRLQEILFYRELGFPLSRIARLLDDPAHDRAAALRGQRELLTLQRDRLDGLIGLLERLMKGDNEVSFHEFDTSSYEAAKEKYAAEVRERWGDTEAYAESEKKAASRGKADEKRLEQESGAIFARFAALRGGDAGSAEAQALVAEWQRFISDNYYRCTREILAGLGEMYVGDERFRENLDRHGAGTAQFMTDAIRIYTR